MSVNKTFDQTNPWYMRLIYTAFKISGKREINGCQLPVPSFYPLKGNSRRLGQVENASELNKSGKKR